MFQKNVSRSMLEDNLALLHARLKDLDPTSDEYGLVTDQITKLTKLLDHGSEKSASSDAIILAGANLLGILVVVAYEQKHVITTKAFGFVSRLK